MKEQTYNIFEKSKKKSKIFPWTLEGPWGTLGGPRESFRKLVFFSKILDLFPEFSWILVVVVVVVLVVVVVIVVVLVVVYSSSSISSSSSGSSRSSSSSSSSSGALRQLGDLRDMPAGWRRQPENVIKHMVCDIIMLKSLLKIRFSTTTMLNWLI